MMGLKEQVPELDVVAGDWEEQAFCHKVFFWLIKTAKSRENQGLKRTLICNFMSGACLLMIWLKVNLKEDQAASIEGKVLILSLHTATVS
ncbi:unnamed protein product [Boreogadus saida]